MKKSFILLVVFMGIIHLAISQQDGRHNEDRQNPAITTSLANLKMEKLTHNYGNIKQGDNGVCEFKFTNNGKEPLVIKNCQSSCGCAVVTCPKDPTPPGKSSVIKVKYDTNRIGGIHKTVTIISNSKSGVVILTIEGNVEAKGENQEFTPH
jgi:preprotein translocase subunit YajC